MNSDCLLSLLLDVLLLLGLLYLWAHQVLPERHVALVLRDRFLELEERHLLVDCGEELLAFHHLLDFVGGLQLAPH